MDHFSTRCTAECSFTITTYHISIWNIIQCTHRFIDNQAATDIGIGTDLIVGQCIFYRYNNDHFGLLCIWSELLICWNCLHQVIFDYLCNVYVFLTHYSRLLVHVLFLTNCAIIIIGGYTQDLIILLSYKQVKYIIHNLIIFPTTYHSCQLL